jgi:hypothetical protein
MFKLTTIIFSAILFYLATKPTPIFSQVRLDSTLINWNKLTFKSLVRQTQLAVDNKQKAMFENKQIAVKKYWRVQDMVDFNDKSTRYKLLKTVFAEWEGMKKDFYIIEANESGSKILLRSFILYLDSAGLVDINFYDFVDGEWLKTGKLKDTLYIQPNLENYISQSGKGFNNDDIIITEFENGRVKESEYILFGTLSKSANIKKVLDSYRKENFIQ